MGEWTRFYLEAPGGPDALHPVLDQGEDGVLRLLWSERWGDEGARIRFAVWDGKGFGEGRTIVEVEQAFLNWVDVPTLAALADGTLCATWLEKTGEGTYAYGVSYGVSRDGGQTWSAKQPWLHGDRSSTEHGFVSLVAAEGYFWSLWLDGRATPAGGPQQLWYRRIHADGACGVETLLDAAVCDCCSTALIPAFGDEQGPWAAWRDRSTDEVRDVRVARLEEGGWQDLGTVHDDGWVIPGCPVNGPRLGLVGDQPVCVWVSGEERNGAWIARWEGVGFGVPQAVNAVATMGRLGSAELADGSLLVSWLEREPGGDARWQLRNYRAAPTGLAAGDPWTLASVSSDRSSGVLRLAARGNEVFAVWDQGPGHGLGLARLVPPG